MNDSERIAQLETRLDNIDKVIDEIKEEQAASRNRAGESTLDISQLKSQLATLIASLQDHKIMHEKQSEKKYKVTDIVLALGMLALAFMEFLK